jgi:hypothetical protein
MDQVMTAATEMDALIPEIWSAAFYPTLKEKLPFIASVATDFEGEISALGDCINIMSFPQFAAAEEISENAAVAADAITVTKTQLVINKQVAKDYIITKKAMKQSMEAQSALRDLALHSILKKMQSVIIAEIVPSASTPDHSIAFDSGTTLALADILEAKELLDSANVEDVGRVMLVGAAQANDLFNIVGLTSRDFLASGSPLTSGAITAPVLGFDVRWTSEAGNVAYLFHPMFLQMAVQQVPQVEVVSLGAEGKRAARVNMDVLFGVKQISNLRVVTIG